MHDHDSATDHRTPEHHDVDDIRGGEGATGWVNIATDFGDIDDVVVEDSVDPRSAATEWSGNTLDGASLGLTPAEGPHCV